MTDPIDPPHVSGPKAIRLRIRGRVQGVWFRGWMVERAGALGLAGWVRNRGDGSVEALISGPAAALEAMLAACRVGPPAATVEDIETASAPIPEDLGFRQLPTL